jgi:hypothetical protein
MAKRVRIQPGEARQIRGLTNGLDEYTVRSLLTPEGGRLIRPERFANLQSGKAKLTEAEKERLQILSANRQALTSLKKKQRGREVVSKRGKELAPRTKAQRENRALRSWVIHGKEKDTPYDVQADSVKHKQQPAIHALFYLGIDPISEKTYYTKGIPAK